MFEKINNKYVSEEYLVQQLKERNESALSYLVNNYGGAMKGIIKRIIDNESLDDLVQETFVRIWKSIDKYDESKGRLFTWMMRIARNLALDVYRSKVYKDALKNQDIDTSEVLINNEYSSNFNIDIIGLKKLVSDLPDKNSIVIDLSYFQGYTHMEIAEELSLPLGTVKTRIAVGLQALRNHYFNELKESIKVQLNSDLIFEIEELKPFKSEEVVMCEPLSPIFQPGFTRSDLVLAQEISRQYLDETINKPMREIAFDLGVTEKKAYQLLQYLRKKNDDSNYQLVNPVYSPSTVSISSGNGCGYDLTGKNSLGEIPQ